MAAVPATVLIGRRTGTGRLGLIDIKLQASGRKQRAGRLNRDMQSALFEGCGEGHQFREQHRFAPGQDGMAARSIIDQQFVTLPQNLVD